MFLKFIVTGTGRCGSVSMAKILTNLGIPCGHESVFNQIREDIIKIRIKEGKHFTVSDVSQIDLSNNHKLPLWVDLKTIQADSSYMAAPYLHWEEIKNVPVVHVVRHPFKVVSSFVKDFNYFLEKKNNHYNVGGWEQWIYTKVPQIKKAEIGVNRGFDYYCEWNDLIHNNCSNRPYLVHRIEDGITPDLCEFLGVSYNQEKIELKANSHKRNRKNFDLKGVQPEIADKVVDHAKRYGYDLG